MSRLGMDAAYPSAEDRLKHQAAAWLACDLAQFQGRSSLSLVAGWSPMRASTGIPPNRWTVWGLGDLLGADRLWGVLLFKGDRGLVAEGGVQTHWVVPAFDVAEDGHAGLGL